VNERAEIMTANREGLDGLLFGLKKQQVRVGWGLERKAVERLERIIAETGSRTKAHKAAKAALTDPAALEKWIEESAVEGVRLWREKNLEVIEEGHQKRLEAARREYGEGELGRMMVELKMSTLSTQAASVDQIRNYLGKLNRDVSDSRVDEYYTAMLKGTWWFTPDPVVVTDDGYIINGQHRLIAAEKLADIDKEGSRTPPTFVVVWGVDKKAALLMDEAKRSADDRRSIAVRYATSMAEVAV
jgi:hypothetical protein